MRSVINDNVELRRAFEHPFANFGSIGIADYDADARVVIVEASAIRIDVATDQGCSFAEVPRPDIERAPILYADFKQTYWLIAVVLKQSLIFGQIQRPLIGYLAFVLPVQLMDCFVTHGYNQ